MYLKQIKTVGFKSFADKVIIDFDNGISGIVGPNGSGKSNVVDAVRWVLGEQSVKALRGEASMSDVIFSGSKSRKASSSASVTLVFDNTDKYLPIDYSEVEIKRCVYKTGENEYFINNEKCRLKDITDLLIDTGVSKESFNIISQGDIGIILSSKPEDRRIIFDACANVLKYKKRKEEALRKLERTHDNMARINDIILELESSIKPLEKQSRDAKKYLDNKKKLDEIEVSLIVSEVEDINYNYQLNKKNVSKLKQEIVEIESNSNIDNSKIEKMKHDLAKQNEELYTMQSELVKKSSLKEKLDGKRKIILERKKYEKENSKVHDNIVLLNDNLLKIKNDISSIDTNIYSINERLSYINNSINNEEKEFNVLKLKHDKIYSDLLNNNKLENETKYKIEIIRNSLENNELLPYSIKNVINNPKLAGIRGVIANVIKVDSDYDLCITSALSSALNYVICDDEVCAKEAINYLKTNNFSRITFFPINIIKSRKIDDTTSHLLKNEEGFVDIASNLVACDDIYKNIIENQLGTTIVTKNIDYANYIARKINYKYKVVTLDGEVLHIGGSITGGTLKNNNNMIMQKHGLEENLKTIETLIKKREELESIINDYGEGFKLIDDKKNKLLEEKTKYEALLNIEYKRKEELNKKELDLTDEINSLSGVVNDTLEDEEKKVMEDYYNALNEENDLSIKIDSIKTLVNSYNDEINHMEKESKVANTLFYKKNEELKELEILVNRDDVKLDNLLNTLTEDYGMTFEKAKANYFLDIDIKEARNIVDKCKLEIKKLGDVNIGAIEEYERVSKRYEFLNNQKRDLENAEDTILKIIKELDEVMKEKFLNTFNEVKIKFKEVFKKLFGGGNAELKLTDPDSILTTGIDISALPPGKTLKHISLLSGGEKTLTAISLLFAILEVRPVPFCILDEVEAALDEVNVDNFGKFLREFKKKTQFIVITHKKKTMEYADCLYGITMQESGISKLVSVKLEDIKEENDE